MYDEGGGSCMQGCIYEISMRFLCALCMFFGHAISRSTEHLTSAGRRPTPPVLRPLFWSSV